MQIPSSSKQLPQLLKVLSAKMILRPFIAALAAASLSKIVAKPIHSRDDFTSKIEQQNKVSLQGVLDNIGPSGSKAPGASAGVIIASPQTEDPNCKNFHDNFRPLLSLLLMDLRFLHVVSRCCPHHENDHRRVLAWQF